ncbi:LOW QUALITY PROTEIN: ejaculatory bulb-specific protein 3-like [Maniola hyperantus]|uniref:LOW QUALITY PROTEIN: ejaculatory bulb-specific protein 3-like n=1 Tax=Aphantopus hyperantus TaxID=2795564 RepID=UPI0037484E0B
MSDVLALNSTTTTGNDHLDVDAFLADRAKTKQFLDCYLDLGPCSELAASYNVRIMPEAIVQACRRCNQDQKHIFWKYLKGIKVMLPEEYRSLREKYDPDNIYFEGLETEISNIEFRY